MKADIDNDYIDYLGKLGVTPKEYLWSSWSFPGLRRAEKCQYMSCGVGPETAYMIASGWVTTVAYRQSELYTASIIKPQSTYLTLLEREASV